MTDKVCIACGTKLRSHNTIGYCRKHRGQSRAFKNQHNATQRSHYASNRDIERERKLYPNTIARWQHYGVDVPGVLVSRDNHDGLCDICGQPSSTTRGDKVLALAMDHDHGTLEHRGWLCHTCNAGLGLFKDNPELIRLAADYLERGGGKSGG